MKSKILSILLFSALLLGKTLGQGVEFYFAPIEEKTAYDGLFLTTWENDMFLKTDYYFSNGAAFEYYSNDLQLPRLEKFLNTPFTLEDKAYSITLRQNMYTPKDLSKSEIQFDDRPYSGYMILEYKVVSESSNRRFSSSITFGLMGEYSLAGYTQNLVHSGEKNEAALGWDYQVNNAPVLNLNYKHEQVLHTNRVFDLQYSIAGRLGGLYTDASVATTLRIGKRNSTFDYTSLVSRSSNIEYYIYFTAAGKVSYYDATLQGSILINNPGDYYLENSDRHLLVGNLTSGLVLAYKQVRIVASVTKITPEIKGGLSHGWGAISIGFAF